MTKLIRSAGKLICAPDGSQLRATLQRHHDNAVAARDAPAAGRNVCFTGDQQDPYLQSLPAFHEAAPRLEYYLRHHMRADGVCLDIGANIGLTAILLSTYCPQGRIYCFEASPKNAHYLRANLRDNNITNCEVINAAVGAGPGTVAFRETEFCAGSHVARETSTGHDASLIRVPMMSIDSFATERAVGASAIELIKIDVEGYEPAVLAGGRHIIRESGCPIFMEFNSWCLMMLQNFSPLAFATTLFDAFQVRRVTEQGALAADIDPSVGSFMYQNIFRNGCVDDVLISLKPGRTVPSFEEMTNFGGG